METSEIIKIAISTVVGAYTLFAGLHKIYSTQKVKKILSSDEMDFILTRGGNQDALNTQITLLKEKQLIEKAYGFSASREEFNALVTDLKGSKIRLTQLKRINSYLSFKNNKASISLGAAEWLLFVLNTLFAMFFLTIAIVIAMWAKDEPYRFFKIVGLFAAVLFPVYFVMYPTYLALQVKKALKLEQVVDLKI